MMTTREQATEGQIPLQAGIKDRLARLSTLMGVSPVALASHAIQSWVAEQERALALIESLGDAVGGEMGPRLKEMLRTGLFARQENMAGGPELTEGEVGAIAEQEDLLDCIAGVSVVGGVFNSKEADAPNVTELYPKKYGEFNFLLDPDATDQFFKICARRSKPIPIALFERGFTHHHCRFSQEQTKLLQKNPNNLLSNRVAEALNSISLANQGRFFKAPSHPIHNVFPIMMLINDSLFEGEELRIRCQNSTGAYPGKVEVVDESDATTVFMITAIKPELEQKFFEIYCEKLSKYAISPVLPSAPTSSQPQYTQPITANQPRKFNQTQALAILPEGMNADQMKAILDVCQGSSPPRFQNTPNSTDSVNERSVFFIFEDEQNSRKSDRGMAKK
jgi:hypothetical protein